jgi:hypothetical protein
MAEVLLGIGKVWWWFAVAQFRSEWRARQGCSCVLIGGGMEPRAGLATICWGMLWHSSIQISHGRVDAWL